VKILFFAPHAALWAHAFPEALIAESLQQHGHKVIYVTCGRQLRRHCVPMSAHGLTPHSPEDQKRRVCGICERHAALLRQQFDLHGPQLVELIGQAEEQAVDTVLASMTPARIHEVEFEQVPVGELALYHLMLRHKRIDLDLSQEQWSDYLVELRNTLYAAHAARKLIDEERPDRILVYNALYPVTRVACKLGERRGIAHYFLHAGGNLSNRLQTLLLGRGDTFSFMPRIVAQWPRYRDLPCGADLLARVTDHYLELLRGKSVFVYSQRRSGASGLRARFGISETQKLLVMAMGSYDEEVAAELVGARRHARPPLFASQIEWVQAVLDYVRDKPELFLLIRVHPREFPNRREAVTSQHARQLQNTFLGLPVNAAVNWPADGVSIYDLADQADVFLNSWSSVGKEMSLLGIPVVIYSSDLPFYAADLNYLGTTLPEYLQAIEQALREGWSATRARMAYRWGAYEFIRATIFIGDSFPEVEHQVRPLYRRAFDRVRRKLDPMFKERSNCRRRRPRLAAAADIAALIESGKESLLELGGADVSQEVTLEEETTTLRGELRRLIAALYPEGQALPTSRLFHHLTAFAGRT
jgi:hypothetical protein